MITTWVYSMDATMNMTDDLKKMSVDDANVQNTHKECDSNNKMLTDLQVHPQPCFMCYIAYTVCTYI